jgi:hypothetical protein
LAGGVTAVAAGADHTCALTTSEAVLCWSVNFKGRSAVSLRLSTETFYEDYPSRAVAADVNGILMRVASLRDTLRGKIKVWAEPGRRPSKRLKDLADIARPVEAHPELWDSLPGEVKERLPKEG